RAARAAVAVMVDVSGSTRGAGYRNRAELERRIKQLLGETPYHVSYFSDRNISVVAEGGTLGDLAGERTVFAPPAAAAVVLFSDGRFELPGIAPPVFVVADPELDRVDDAGVDRLEVRGGEVVAHVHNVGPAPRRVTLEGVATQPSVAIEGGGGAIVITREVRKDARVATAQVNGGDRWPENDGLSAPVAVGMRTQRWLVSNGAAARGAGEWVVMKPGVLPTDGAAYLAPSVIVLDNLAAGELSGAQLARVEQYVRDLGGAMVIAGGDRAFASGLYAGTALEALSPLASSPPTPGVHWMLLADSSGSMSEGVGETTRWQIAASAIARLIPNLPPADPVSVGSFAAELTWWSDGKAARETAGMALPPAGVAPNGPTNLAAALERIAREADGGLAGELLVVSDADTTIDHPDELAQRLKAKRIRLHLLAIGDGRGLEMLRAMTVATGGTLRRELDPRKWAGEVRRLLAAAWPERLIASAVKVQYEGDLAPLSGREVGPWNRTWLKKGASELAGATHEGERVPMCARWTVGNGDVIACGFVPSDAELAAMAKRIARPPRDPRFTVGWEAGARLVVRVDAAEEGRYLNGLALRLELADENDAARVSGYDVPQVGPGRYEVSLPAPRVRSFATLRQEGRVVDRVAVAGRYAPEFDAVGNDHAAMRTLAERTGGRVIDPGWVRPIDFPFPKREVALAPWLALGAAGVVGLGLIRWRMGD
ncbi:MAG: hypothetical protein JWN40_2298, partial [Phycisphaerales bacterium]|nr:hypothetical protein [Phycisphaerales bacterium]